MSPPHPPASAGNALLLSTLALTLWLLSFGVAQAAPLYAGGDHTGETHAGEDHAGEMLAGITLAYANLERSDFRYTDLRDATVWKAQLRGALFAGADLAGSDLRGSDVYKVDFADADLRGADLTRLRNPDMANYCGAMYDAETLLDPAIDSTCMIFFSGDPAKVPSLSGLGMAGLVGLLLAGGTRRSAHARRPAA